MRRAIIILNVFAAIGLIFLSHTAIAAHRAHAFSVYCDLESNHALVQKPTNPDGKPIDVLAHLRSIAAGGSYYSMLGYLGAGACLLNGLSWFFSRSDSRRRDDC